ncbi:hypothetical protein ACHAW6_012984 [Cyclotella cf. meneghiniana]
MKALLNDTTAPVLPLNSIQSIITITSNNNVNVPTPSRSKLARHSCPRRLVEPVPSFDCYAHNPSVSIVRNVIRCDSSNDGTLGECVSVVASCIPPRLGRSAHPREGKINVATLYNSPDIKDRRKRATVRMNYSCKVCAGDKISFVAVNLVSVSGDLLQTNGSEIAVLLLAIDTMGRLYSCQFAPQNDEAVRQSKLQECPLNLVHFGSNENAESKQRRQRKVEESGLRGLTGPLIFMNTLTARLENASQQSSNHNTQDIILSTQESNFSALSSSTTRKSRSRKRKSGPMNNAESTLPCFPARTRGIYVVASCLSGPSFLPETAPLVMYLSPTYEQSSPNASRWQCLASTKISMLYDVNVPLKCIVFTSRSICGAALWECIKSVVLKNNNALNVDSASECDEDEGVVLMGLQDGSLQASIVKKHTIPDKTTQYGTNEAAIKLYPSRTSTLLEANGEPLLSLQFISPESSCEHNGQSPILVGIGERGLITVISSVKTGNTDNPTLFIFRQAIQCENRMISMQVTECELCGSLSSDVVLTFLGVYDCGRTLLHRVEFRLKDRLVLNWKDEKVRLPVPAGMSVYSTTFAPSIRLTSIFGGFLFALSHRSGDVVLFKMNADHYKSPLSYAIKSPNMIKGPICSLLLSRADIFSLCDHNKRKSRRKTASPTKKHSTRESLLQKLDSAIKCSDLVDYSSCPSIFVTQKSIREIREATSVLSRYIRNSDRPNYSQLPWTIKTVSSSTPGVFDCTITKHETVSTNQTETNWDFSFHVIHPCPLSMCRTYGVLSSAELTPVCYRCSRWSDSAFTKVVQVGTVTSYCSKASKGRQLADTHVQVPSFQPVFMFVALQMRYRHVCEVITWQNSKSIIRPSCESEFPVPGRGATCSCDHKLGIAFPFDIGAPHLDFMMAKSIAFQTNHSNDHAPTREHAEKILHQWFHDRHHAVSDMYRHPRLKEEYSTRNHHSKCAPLKQISCCVRSIHLLHTSRNAEILFRNTNPNSQNFACVSNDGCCAFSLVLGPSDKESASAVNLPELNTCCFAVGSILNLGETMSSLSSLRHMIIRQLLEQKHRDGQEKNGPLELILVESYRFVLANKKTLKIASHVKRSAVSLLSSISNGKCLDETLSAALALYDIMRTIIFVLN